MDTLTALSMVWGVVTILFVSLIFYRMSITKNEKDWIALTNDSKEDAAIQAQMANEVKTRKLKVPITTLGFVSLAMFLVIAGVWVMHTLSNPPTS
jgi:hypothetical protein